MKRVSLFVILMAASALANAQTIHDGRIWVNFTAQGPLAKKSSWRWYVDSYERNRESGRTPDQFVVRPGVGYALTKQSSVWAGYAYTANFTSGGRIDENRIWQQYVWSGPAKTGTLSSRTRLEQRFIEGAGGMAWRIREQLKFARPLSSRSRLSSLVSFEIMFHLNSTARAQRGFDQSRAFAGLSISVNRTAHVEVGYLNQFNRSQGPDRMHHILSGVLGLAF